MFEIGPGGQVSAQAHGDGAGRDLRQPGDHDDGRGFDRARQSGRQGERHCQAVGHTDHDVADSLRGFEMSLDMRGYRHRATVAFQPQALPLDNQQVTRLFSC